MSGFHFKHFSDYEDAVIDEVESISKIPRDSAENIVKESKGDVVYGHGLRLSPAIIAGKILGINHCCAGVN